MAGLATRMRHVGWLAGGRHDVSLLTELGWITGPARYKHAAPLELGGCSPRSQGQETELRPAVFEFHSFAVASFSFTTSAHEL